MPLQLFAYSAAAVCGALTSLEQCVRCVGAIDYILVRWMVALDEEG
jgi:hypothetical protein